MADGTDSIPRESRREAIVPVRLLLKSPPSSLFGPKRPFSELLALPATEASRCELALPLRLSCLEVEAVLEKTSRNFPTTGAATELCFPSLFGPRPDAGEVAACLGGEYKRGEGSDVTDDDSGWGAFVDKP